MTIREIENQVDHRPWPMPPGKWRYYQEWNDALFLHWKVDYATLRKWVPPEMEIDQIDGSPWVSLVAFTMEKIRPRYLPPFPPISNFTEINIRTYVKFKGKAGVYFLSIEGGKQLSCWVAKGLSELPYRFSEMECREGYFSSRNAIFGDSIQLQYTPGPELEPNTEIDAWLTERYALFQDAGDHINAFDIHHLPWTINTLAVDHLKLSYPRFEKLINDNPDIVRYSPGVRVLAWDKQQSPRRQ